MFSVDALPAGALYPDPTGREAENPPLAE